MSIEKSRKFHKKMWKETKSSSFFDNSSGFESFKKPLHSINISDSGNLMKKANEFEEIKKEKTNKKCFSSKTSIKRLPHAI